MFINTLLYFPNFLTGRARPPLANRFANNSLLTSKLRGNSSCNILVQVLRDAVIHGLVKLSSESFTASTGHVCVYERKWG